MVYLLAKMAAQSNLPKDILSMKNLFETVYSEDVFNLKPNLPEVGVTCEYYLTDYSTRKSFFYWHDEFKELEKINSFTFTDQDKIRLKFLNLPCDIRQEIHQRIFGSHWQYRGTKKSLYVAGLACFKPDAIIINSIYSQATYLKDKSDNNQRRQKDFIENIRRGTF